MSKSVTKNMMAKMALNILNVVLPLITGPYLAHVLDVELYGQYNRAFALISWFIPFASLGIYNYGIRVISQAKKDPVRLETLFTSLFTMGVISTTLVTGVYLLYALFVPSAALVPLYLLLSIQLVASAFLVEWMNEAFENYGFILYKTLIIRVLYVISIFIFVRKSGDILPYTFIASLVLLVNNLCSFAYVKRKVRFRRIGKRDLTGLIKPLLVMLLLTNASMFYTTLDRLFVSVFAKDTPAYTSFYTFSLTITQLITNVINAIVLATIPRLAAYLGENRQEDYHRLLHSSSRTFFMLGIPMSIGISVMAYPIMFIYGNEAYLPAGLTLAIFGVRCLLWLCDIVLANQVIFVHCKESLLTRIYFTGGAVNLLLNSLLVVFRQVRPEWMILTTIVSEIVLVLLQWRCVRLNFGKSIRVFDWHTLKYLLTALCFYPIVILINRFGGLQFRYDMRFFTIVVISVGVCAVFYGTVLLATKDEALFHLLRTVKNKIFRRGSR